MKNLVALLATLFLCPSAAQADCTKVRLAGRDSWFPVAFRDSQGKLQGTAVFTARKAFEPLGVEVEVVPNLPWKRMVQDLEQGQLDVIAGAYHNSERARKFLYTRPFAEDVSKIFVRADSSLKVQKLEDLKGRRGVRPLGGTYGDVFDAFAKKHLQMAEQTEARAQLMMVMKGRADFVILALHDGRARLKKFGLVDQIVPLDFDVARNPVHLMLSKKSPCAARLRELDAEIEKLERSGEIERAEKQAIYM